MIQKRILLGAYFGVLVYTNILLNLYIYILSENISW